MLANRASARKSRARKQERIIKLRTEHEELLQIREDVSVQLTEIDIEETELQAEITAMEIRRDEPLSQNHANIVTSHEEGRAPKSG